MDLCAFVSERLSCAQAVLEELPDKEVRRAQDAARLAWLERLLCHLVSQLRGLLVELEEGVSLAGMGFGAEDEFLEMLEGIGAEIANLKGLIQTAKNISR